VRSVFLRTQAECVVSGVYWWVHQNAVHAANLSERLTSKRHRQQSPQSDTVSPQSETFSPQNDTVSPQSDTSFDVDEHSLRVARNPLNKRDSEKDEVKLGRLILCTNETLEPAKIDSSITGYIRNNWYVDRCFAIFR
jgi:hypothetical protein